MKIAHSFLQSVQDQFHVIILSLPIRNSAIGCQRIFRNRLLKMENGTFQSLELFLTNLENQLHCTSEFVPKALKQLF